MSREIICIAGLKEFWICFHCVTLEQKLIAMLYQIGFSAKLLTLVLLQTVTAPRQQGGKNAFK